MLTIEQVIERLSDAVDRMTVERYISHAWVKPVTNQKTWYFEEIDVARIRLVHNLHEEMMVNEEAMDIVLSLLDQVYSHRERMRRLMNAIGKQPDDIQKGILAIVEDGGKE